MVTLTAAGHATLDAPAAESYARAIAAGAPDSVTSSYRDPDEQMRFYQGWINRLPGYNFALHPAKSDHCKGLAIDLRGSAAKTWFRAHGRAYGWLFTDASEDWHIAYRPAYDTHRNDTQEDDDMTPDQAAQLAATDAAVKNLERAMGQVQDSLASINSKGERTLASLTRVEATLKATGTAITEWVNRNIPDRIIASLTRVEAVLKPFQSGINKPISTEDPK